MGTFKRSLRYSAAVGAMLAGAVGVPSGVSAQALIGSDIPAAIVTFPVVRVGESSGIPASDTFIQLANTNEEDVRAAQCFYINGIGTCSFTEERCLVNFDCPGAPAGEQCIPDWAELNFFIELTANQPLGWQASVGAPVLPCSGMQVPEGPPTICDQTAVGSVPFVEAPFRGFLTCVSTISDSDTDPIAANDLIGTATVETADPLDNITYNAVGIQATDDVGTDRHLCLGGAPDTTCPDAEYASCPQTLILNHLFDRGDFVVNEGDVEVQTRLVIIPCTQLEAPRPDRQEPDVVPTTAQFLVFNEFEQRFSTSTRASCYTDLLLSDIDTRPSFPQDNSASIFGIGVQGTLGGQSRIRGVATAEPDVGHGLLAVAIQSISSEAGISSAAVNTNFIGVRGQPDVICTAPGACEPDEAP